MIFSRKNGNEKNEDVTAKYESACQRKKLQGTS